MTDLERSLESALRAQMQRQGLTSAELARRLGVKPPHVSRVLSRQTGRIPDSLADVLAELGLRLTLTPLEAGDDPTPAFSAAELQAARALLIPPSRAGRPQGLTPPVPVDGPPIETLLAGQRGPEQ